VVFGVISGNINPRGAAGDKSQVFGNPDFTKKLSLETDWSVCFKVFKVCGAKF